MCEKFHRDRLRNDSALADQNLITRRRRRRRRTTTTTTTTITINNNVRRVSGSENIAYIYQLKLNHLEGSSGPKFHSFHLSQMSAPSWSHHLFCYFLGSLDSITGLQTVPYPQN